MQPPKQTAQTEKRQTLLAAMNEIEELKETLRYVEISLAKQKEESEHQKKQIVTLGDEQDKVEGDLKERNQQLSEAQFEVELLQKKIAGFGKSQGERENKNKFKASNYMTEIMGKDSELQKARTELLENEEEMKQLSITREKFIRERDHLITEMKQYEVQIRELRE